MEVLDRLHRLMGQRDACVAQIAVLREQLAVSREERERVQRERDIANAQLRDIGLVPYLDRMTQLARERDEARERLARAEQNFDALEKQAAAIICQRERLRALLREVRLSGVECDVLRNYVTVQIDRDLWADLAAALEGRDA